MDPVWTSTSAFQFLYSIVVLYVVIAIDIEWDWPLYMYCECLQEKTMALLYQDTCSYVSGQETMWCTSVLFTGTTNLQFSNPLISIITGPISIKFKYCMP